MDILTNAQFRETFPCATDQTRVYKELDENGRLKACFEQLLDGNWVDTTELHNAKDDMKKYTTPPKLSDEEARQKAEAKELWNAIRKMENR